MAQNFAPSFIKCKRTDILRGGKRRKTVFNQHIAKNSSYPALRVAFACRIGKNLGKGVMLCTDALIRDMTDVIPYIDFAFNTVSVLPL